jgi:exodeoxyribonuclease-5
MLTDFLASRITQELPFHPTPQQTELIIRLADFLSLQSQGNAFLLKGYAGTGKTSVLSALVKAMNRLQQKIVLLAPTGRAAKVFSSYSGFIAYTIHKKIYRQKSFTEPVFLLAENLHTDTLFIVDEASMIANSAMDTNFGTGNLLDDMIHYVYSGAGCSLIVVGDTAQLPPVMLDRSPALESSILEGYGLQLIEYTLTTVVRQALESGILYNATLLRQALDDELTSNLPNLKINPFTDIIILSGTELSDEIQQSYDGVGATDTIIITRSNRSALFYNVGIRGRVMQKDEELSNGDLLMITRNNYYWNKEYKEIDFVANGDIVEVIRLKKSTEMYGFRFAELSLRSLDVGWEIDALVLLESLYTETPTQMKELGQLLFERVQEDYIDIKSKRERYKQLQENEYLNALQVKFAYSVTCHKAQGGQWKKVFIDMNLMPDMLIDRNYYRWLYTALTRATETVYLINYHT